jgi:hypothetical protein
MFIQTEMVSLCKGCAERLTSATKQVTPARGGDIVDIDRQKQGDAP